MLLIDGDILTYTVGFIAETRWYELNCPDTGDMMVFQNKRDIKEYNSDLTEDDYVMNRSCLDANIAYGILDEIVDSWKRKFNRTGYKVFLTDTDLKNNFRWKLDNEYKANRKGAVKPLLYTHIRDYLCTKYNAEVVVGIEADDALGIAQTKHTIIISKDKDLLQVPGEHFNISSNKVIHATENGSLEVWVDAAGKKRLTGHGFKWFCAQMLLGDDVDNIKGINRVGAVKTHALLSKLRTKETMWNAVKEVYKKHNREQDLLTNAQLLWILKTSNGYFNEEEHCKCMNN
jgi:5'-3' exonuclease